MALLVLLAINLIIHINCIEASDKISFKNFQKSPAAFFRKFIATIVKMMIKVKKLVISVVKTVFGTGENEKKAPWNKPKNSSKTKPAYNKKNSLISHANQSKTTANKTPLAESTSLRAPAISTKTADDVKQQSSIDSTTMSSSTGASADVESSSSTSETTQSDPASNNGSGNNTEKVDDNVTEKANENSTEKVDGESTVEAANP